MEVAKQATRSTSEASADTADRGKTWNLVPGKQQAFTSSVVKDSLKYRTTLGDKNPVLRPTNWSERIEDADSHLIVPTYNWTLNADESVAVWTVEVNFPDFFASWYGNWVSVNVDFVTSTTPVAFLNDQGFQLTYNFDELLDFVTSTRSWSSIDFGTGRALGSFAGRVRKKLPLKAVFSFQYNLEPRAMQRISQMFAVASIVLYSTNVALRRRLM